MKGNIYSDQKCLICNCNFKHFEPKGLWCPNHPESQPTRLKVIFGELTKRFKSYDQAYRFLTGVRYETDMGKFDIRDYQRDNPLGFETLVKKFIKSKRKLKAVKEYERRLGFGVNKWHNRIIKEIGFAEIQELLNELDDQGKSTKYIYDILSCLKMFWNWAIKCEDTVSNIQTRLRVPNFPDWDNTMAFRKILTKDEQIAVLDEVKKLTWGINPRIYIGILFLSTYINIRPNELKNIQEKHIELENRRILIPHPKEGSPKYVYLIDEDAELLQSMPRGFPELYFFRHIKYNQGAIAGQRFGRDLMSVWWKRACENLNIEGVPLYPGTRHTTAVAQRENHSPEAIKRSMGTKTNKAFERYLQVSGNELRKMYHTSRAKIIKMDKIKKEGPDD